MSRGRQRRKGRSRKVQIRLAKSDPGGHGNRMARAGRIRKLRRIDPREEDE